MTLVSNDDRISAALSRLAQAERLVIEARRIFSYANSQTRGTRTAADINEPVDGLYPGQKGYIEEEECDT